MPLIVTIFLQTSSASPTFIICPCLLSPLLHGQDLYHADKDVDEVKLERDRLVDGVAPEETTLRHPGMGEDLLGVVERKSTEDGETSVQPEILGPHQSASSGSWKDEWGKT